MVARRVRAEVPGAVPVHKPCGLTSIDHRASRGIPAARSALRWLVAHLAVAAEVGPAAVTNPCVARVVETFNKYMNEGALYSTHEGFNAIACPPYTCAAVISQVLATPPVGLRFAPAVPANVRHGT